MRVWVIITSSLINLPIKGRDYETRKKEYILGISKIIEAFKGYNTVIVENNSLLENKPKLRFLQHKTFLDNFGVPVIYTRTNQLATKNYGTKELLDIFECIKRCNIQDDDFIVKITGRYILSETSNFVNEVKLLDKTNYDVIVRYNCYRDYQVEDVNYRNCVSGLIGLRCKYVKQIEMPDEDAFVEEKWTNVISKIEESKICVLEILGIHIRPAGEEYHFLV